MQTKQIKGSNYQRVALFQRETINIDERTVDLAFSSEEPVDRFFGTEILDHSPSSVRLGRLRDGGPILVDHDPRDHVGVTASVSIDGDRRGRVTARFGQSARAKEIFQDVVDGIRKSVSVGYRIHKAVLEQTGSDGTPDVYRVTDWEPLEVSLVSIPADATVGVGRSQAEDEQTFIVEIPQEKRSMEQQTTPAAAAAPTAAAPVTVVDNGPAERARATEILALAKRYGHDEMASEFIANGKSANDFRAALLERHGNTRPTDAVAPVDLELTEREHKQYSLVRALHAASTGDWKHAGFEREISEDIGKQLKRGTEGFFMPTALRMSAEMTRAKMVAGTPGVGGYTVDTEMQSMIELLRNQMLVKQLGAQVLSGLSGPLAFPRQLTSNTLYWVGENPGADVTEGNATFDQLPMAPKSAQATTGYSRQLLAQSSTDVEAFVRNDLMMVNALGLDLAAINGSGTSNQPMGILNTTGIGDVAGGTNGLAPTWAHIVALETAVAVANADVGNIGYLTNAKVRGKLKGTEKFSTTGQVVWQDGATPLNGYKAGVSNQVPSNLTKGTSVGVASAIIFGNWADLMIGEWGAMEMIVDPYALKKQGLIEVTSIMMVDIAVRQATSFAAMKDALTT